MGAENPKITAGYLSLTEPDDKELSQRIKRTLPSLDSANFMVSIAVSYDNPAEQERAEAVVAEELEKFDPDGVYHRVINSNDLDGGVDNQRTDGSL